MINRFNTEEVKSVWFLLNLLFALNIFNTEIDNVRTQNKQKKSAQSIPVISQRN